jgi:hypothetical protein
MFVMTVKSFVFALLIIKFGLEYLGKFKYIALIIKLAKIIKLALVLMLKQIPM